MAIYFVVYFILAFCCFLDLEAINKKQREVLIVGISLLLIFFTALRFGNQDYDSYILIFENSKGWNFDASGDKGYVVLNSLLACVSDNPIIVFIVVAILSVCLNISSYGNYSKYIFVSMLFYYVHSYVLKEMIQMRAGLACAIGLYNIRNINQFSSRKFWFFEVLSLSIHFGSIIYIFAWISSKYSFSTKKWFAYLCICLVIGLICPLGSFLKNIPGMELLERVQNYSQWDEYSGELGVLTNPATIKQLFISIIICVYYKKICQHIKYCDVICSMYFMSTCWLMLWNDFAIVGARMATFLSVGEPVIISSMLFLVTNRSRIYLVSLLLTIAALFLYINMQGKVMPYQFYFNNI